MFCAFAYIQLWISCGSYSTLVDMNRRVLGLALALVIAGCASSDGVSEDDLRVRAADPTGVGPSAAVVDEYKFDAETDPNVLSDRATELWASIHRPKVLPQGKLPLVIFMHGNHPTCGLGGDRHVDVGIGYTKRGSCAAGFRVVPNHRGYDYLAERLVSWGYVVVSINANRGITGAKGIAGDSGLNLARGRLILKHLGALARWNNGQEAPPAAFGSDLVGRLDLDEVGMMGHSRGGEAVRAALAQYRDAGSPWPARIGPIGFKGIFEIAPVDGQTSRVLDATGVAWEVLLPRCDGDVKTLAGKRPFDRMLPLTNESTPTPKGAFMVFGANHNFYNTEWQTTDSRGCKGHPELFGLLDKGSQKQRTTGLYGLLAFFRANVGKDKNSAYAAMLDPQYTLPTGLDFTRVERSYTDALAPSYATLLADIGAIQDANIKKRNVTTAREVPEFHRGTRGKELSALRVDFARTDASVTIPFSALPPSSAALDVIEFRIAAGAGLEDGLRAGVSLLDANGNASSPVRLADYVDVRSGKWQSMFQSVRIPVNAFSMPLASARALTVTFDSTRAGSVYLSQIRATKRVGDERRPVLGVAPPIALGGSDHGSPGPTTGNRIVAVRRGGPAVEVELETTEARPFGVNDAMPQLVLGQQTVSAISDFPDDGNLRRLVFQVDAASVPAAGTSVDVAVRMDTDDVDDEGWTFGALP